MPAWSSHDHLVEAVVQLVHVFTLAPDLPPHLATAFFVSRLPAFPALRQLFKHSCLKQVATKLHVTCTDSALGQKGKGLFYFN